MLASNETRKFYTKMYNDEIMILYLIMAVYYVERPYISALLMSLSLSVKAGGILIMPAFLGQI